MIHINHPTQHYVNNTMYILEILIHFYLNVSDSLLEPCNLERHSFEKVPVFYKTIIKLGKFDWTQYNIVKGHMKE